eukprot:CAMPEP_0115118472 /NCGR_PEP_ID=MMETSP0227-20121206/44513_1 /TAXON_ID=89957 /ORGANISM="Polarella glacialis, Strain CCMP 1383" /LENGTH=39 /DNA_ID= /DNA_START= /DNA_END= /DNA_ORIENTATION=
MTARLKKNEACVAMSQQGVVVLESTASTLAAAVMLVVST